MATDDRSKKGEQILAQLHAWGTPNVLGPLEQIAPDLKNIIRDFAFGEIYSRPGLDLKQQQLVTVSRAWPPCTTPRWNSRPISTPPSHWAGPRTNSWRHCCRSRCMPDSPRRFPLCIWPRKFSPSTRDAKHETPMSNRQAQLFALVLLLALLAIGVAILLPPAAPPPPAVATSACAPRRFSRTT